MAEVGQEGLLKAKRGVEGREKSVEIVRDQKLRREREGDGERESRGKRRNVTIILHKKVK